MPEGEREKLQQIVRAAHLSGRRVRFWDTPDEAASARENVWRELWQSGVDLIASDDLEGLKTFLLAQ